MAEIRGAYTVMVRFVLGVRVCSRETRTTNAQLLRGFPKVEAMLLQRRLRFAGHIWRSKEIARDLLFAESPKRYKTRVGRPYLTYPAQLERDTGLRGDELRECMSDRAAWDALVTAKAQELKEAASRPPPGRTSIAPVGTGRGRKRKPLSELSAAARRMRRVNAEKKLAQLVCRVCHTQACSVHCQVCGGLAASHHFDDLRECRRCLRTFFVKCGVTGGAGTATICPDCHVLEEDLQL